ncbi:MAG: sigma-54-dependent transcriptional regulator [Bradymonadia bacterium]|jgi:two-component system response regulator HydG
MNARAPAPAPTPTTTIRVLVVDDEPVILKVWTVMLRRDEFEVATCSSAQEALQALQAHKIDVVVTDVMMPGIDGMELLKRIKAARPEVEVIVMTGKGSIQDAVRAMKEGAFDYLTKPFVEIEECVNRVRQAARVKRLHDENVALRQQVDAAPNSALIDSVSTSMKPVMSLVAQVARASSNVLITGPTGAGKSAIARSIHDRSPRKDGPFMHVDCGVLSKELMSSELFGHKKGAHSTAFADKDGLFHAADGGTIFLDEIGNLHLDAQQQLLKVISDQVVRRVGDTRDTKVDVRIIAATNADLPTQVQGGRFREDLYFRLRVVEVRLPGLNERRDDVPRLAYHFLRRHAARNGKDLKNIAARCMEILRAHDYKGNIRELDNAIERAVIFESGTELSERSLPAEFGTREGAGLAVDPVVGQVDLELPMREAMERAETSFRVAYLLGLMRRYKNVSASARHAQVERANFRRLLKRYGITDYEKGHVNQRDDEDDEDE